MEAQAQHTKPRKPSSKLARNLKFGLGLTLGLGLAGALAGGWWLRQAWQDLPAVEHLAQDYARESWIFHRKPPARNRRTIP